MAFSFPILWSNLILLRYLTENAPCVLPCPKTQEHQSTCVDSWVHRVPENGHQPLGRGNSLWRSACPILWSNPFLLRYFTKIVPSVLPCPKTQEHQSTCVDSRVHRVPENGHQPLGRDNSLWRSTCPILWSNPILLRYFTKIAPSVLLAFRPFELEESKYCYLCYRITLSIVVILSGKTLTTSVIVKTFNDICVSFTSTSNIGLLVVVYPILLLW